MELFRHIATELGWADGDWFFTCVAWMSMIEDIMSADGSCTMAAAGANVSPPEALCVRAAARAPRCCSICWILAARRAPVHCVDPF
mgnify:CR=1 FL=1